MTRTLEDWDQRRRIAIEAWEFGLQVIAPRSRMAGRVSPAWCPHCHATPGLDCPSRGWSKRQVRRAEKRELRRSLRP